MRKGEGEAQPCWLVNKAKLAVARVSVGKDFP